MTFNSVNHFFKMFFASKIKVGIILTLISFATMYYMHGPVMTSPNNYMLSYEGEAARVYYVLSSHAKSDSSYTNFEGMNYPYGEHIIFCDGQPLLANSFKAFSNIFPGAIDYAVGFQNTISLYAFIVGAILLYIFLLYWKIPPWYAALTGFVLMLIGPQVLRMPWHPGLAYACFVPLLLLLYQQFLRRRSWKLTVLILIVNAASFFVNVYLGVMSVGVFAITASWLLYKERWKNFTPYLQSIVQIIVPGMLFLLYQGLTDGRMDRVDTPTGTLDFTSTLSSVFASPYSPLTWFYEWIGVDFIDVFKHGEGMSYVGMTCNLLILFFVTRAIIRLVKRKRVWVYLDEEKKLLLFIGFLFLIIGMGIPFVLHESFHGLLDMLSPLKQLRGWGRFTWVFTFSINLIVMYLLYQVINHKVLHKVKRLIGFAMASLFLLFCGLEGTYLHAEAFVKQVPGNPFVAELLKDDKLVNYMEEAIAAIDPEDYSAIVPIPYFHWGSELFLTPSSSSFRAELEAFVFAYHSGLPMTACFTSRNSRQESINAFQFFAPSMLKKNISNDIPTSKPLLLLYSRHVVNSPSADEKRVLGLGEIVYDSPMVRLISVMPEDIWKLDGSLILSWLEEYKESYHHQGQISYYGDQPPVYLSYDEEQTQTALSGGALEWNSDKRTYIFDQLRDAMKLDTGTYELSFWFENSKNRSQSHLVMETFDLAGDIIKKTDLWNAKRTASFVGDWMRWQHVLKIRSDTMVKFYIEQPFNNPGWVVDEMMLKKEENPVYVQTKKGTWFWNNYPLNIEE